MDRESQAGKPQEMRNKSGERPYGDSAPGNMAHSAPRHGIDPSVGDWPW